MHNSKRRLSALFFPACRRTGKGACLPNKRKKQSAATRGIERRNNMIGHDKTIMIKLRENHQLHLIYKTILQNATRD